MSQSSFIAGTLFVAFVIYVIVKGEASAWIALLLPQTQPANGSTATSALPSVGQVVMALTTPSGAATLLSSTTYKLLMQSGIPQNVLKNPPADNSALTTPGLGN